MAEEYGPTFITVTDEDGREIVLEFIDALEYNGQQYQAFFPAETEGEDDDDPDNGLVILKVIHEDGEELLSTLDGCVYAERVCVTDIANINKAKKAIKKAFQKQMNGEGFTFIEVLSTCPTN